MVEPTKSRDVVHKSILGDSTLAICTHFPPKLLYDVTFSRCSSALSDAVFIEVNQLYYIIVILVFPDYDVFRYVEIKTDLFLALSVVFVVLTLGGLHNSKYNSCKGSDR